MKYVEERKYDLYDRIGVAVALSIIWGLFGTGGTTVIGEIIVALWLVFCAEFSFEYHKGKLCIRASGQHWVLDGWLRILIWPFAKTLHLCGVKNCPILAYLMTFFFIYCILAGVQALDMIVHIALLWYLYHMRKEEK